MNKDENVVTKSLLDAQILILKELDNKIEVTASATDIKSTIKRLVIALYELKEELL